MARIRTIKPEFFTSEDIVSLTPLARVFYISLWCEADREGRLSWKPRTLKMRYLPGDDCDVDTVAQELIDGELIVLYEHEGSTFAEIPSFKKHQVINNRESESSLPARVSTRASRVKAEGRKEGKGKEGKEPASGDESPSSLCVLNTYIQKCKQEGVKPISDEHYIRTYAEDAGITSDMLGLCWVRFVEDHTEGARKSKKYKDWGQTFANCVKDNWYKFWYVKDGTVQLSSAGEMFKSAFEAKRAKGT